MIFSRIAVIVVATAIFVLLPRSPDVTQYAQDASEVCVAESDRAACYEREVAGLYPEVPVARVFGVVREIRARDRSYQFCHVLAHKLGERVVAEDPERWLDAIPLNPEDGLCSNGFIHGVIVGRFRAEVLDAETL